MNSQLLLAIGQVNMVLYLLPLAGAISLVYSSSRFELPRRIIHRAGKLFVTIILFMALVYGALFGLSFNL